ncbi:hypothetical protein C475_20597 [Halosimplex carlsbadense 2-9-1]|uniref:Uncharacterized protein n=1 Tax=Halosimplex carlsbadense 2-9-1 TaxID=797114 RepID=M0CA87_9EURY|nr:hypothetical protein [Halosimplex carlsbadense]ELZ20211.1 hypothetical protein C475_20597 [Halosimplex carlsbadense 2-9-1]
MELENIPDTFEYPAGQECQVNAGACQFEVDYLCHECGRQLCENCGIGITHQPQLFKYAGVGAGDGDRIQAHCPDCASGHGWNSTVLAAAGIAVALGVMLLWLVGGSSIPVAVIGLALLGAGSYLGYNEYGLKKERPLGDGS